MRARLPGLIGAVIASAMTFAASPTFELAVDVPSTLGSSTFRPYQVARRTPAGYSTVITLPPSVAIGALHRRADGSILFAPAHPVVLGGTKYEPRDVVRYDGASFSAYFDGSTQGVPAHARIDALYLDADGSPVLSFDVPVNLGGAWHLPSSLVEFNGAWSSVFDGPGAGIPRSVNVVGADRTSADQLVLSFDVPVRIAGTLYRQGQLVAWTGSGFQDAGTDALWPPYAQLRDFSFLPASGQIADSLQIDKSLTTPGNLDLRWGASCAGSDNDFEIYEGTLGYGFTSHTPVLCSTAGATSSALTPAAGDRYFLVVPRNAIAEGAYGSASGGTARPASSAACLPMSLAACGL